MIIKSILRKPAIYLESEYIANVDSMIYDIDYNIQCTLNSYIDE